MTKEHRPDLKSAQVKKSEASISPSMASMPLDVKLSPDGKTIVRVKGISRGALVRSAPQVTLSRKRSHDEARVVYFDTALNEPYRSLGKGKKYLIYTWGCQMNVHDTETMAGILELMGFVPTEDEKGADLILFNTCAIRENAEDKVYGELGRLKALKQEKPGLILGMAGCMAQEEGVVARILKSYPHVDLVFGTHNIHRLPVLIHEALMSKEMVVEVWNMEGEIVEHLPKARQGGIKAWVNIAYGCDEFCTYCIVPYTRGGERSRAPEEILSELRDLARQGYKEVTLLGQNVNAYGKDFKTRMYTFADLLKDVHALPIPWVRFTTSHPRDFDSRAVDVLARGGNLLEHIHLPVQSGSDRVLKAMNRKYTREHYLELVAEMRSKIKDVSFTTDIIVGFPGETEEDFDQTLTLVETVRYDGAFTFIYSPREGTPAAKMDDTTPMSVKKARLAKLNEVLARITYERQQTLLGRTVEVLVEGVSKKDETVLTGRTRANKIVHFYGPSSLIGQFAEVRIEDAKTWTLYGKLIRARDVALAGR
ncbi:MAG: tRNA-i(6)A37 methylthiotransferase [Candidatus Carbobacillus altaicus]|uniref:tRNA-2-methylthio-N(6)-dimethylallyladenosine synthase n=1 Tax=Candidatus Carbonibacillus altaicus TaxID=2163959 RepID=A0A2R6XY45_9BACL|nr:MAG: tRNA-i(6)A37 methylthiotransferase [Candidatus Carbobacillus altaicus]